MQSNILSAGRHSLLRGGEKSSEKSQNVLRNPRSSPAGNQKKKQLHYLLTVPLFHSHLNCVKVCRRGFFLLSLKRIRSECSGEQKTGSRKGSGSRTNGADYCAATTCRSARLTGRPSSRLSAFSIASLLMSSILTATMRERSMDSMEEHWFARTSALV